MYLLLLFSQVYALYLQVRTLVTVQPTWWELNTEHWEGGSDSLSLALLGKNIVLIGLRTHRTALAMTSSFVPSYLATLPAYQARPSSQTH
jgi:hypothetical protein